MDDDLPICVGCQGHRVLAGRFLSHESVQSPALFRWFFPESRWRRVSVGIGPEHIPVVRLSGEAFLCLDCGMAWTSIDPSAATSEVTHWGEESLKTRLGLAIKSVPPDDEIA
jgi:hypothetical protein